MNNAAHKPFGLMPLIVQPRLPGRRTAINRVRDALGALDKLTKHDLTNEYISLVEQFDERCKSDSRFLTRLSSLEQLIKRQSYHLQLDRIFSDEAIRTTKEGLLANLE